MYPTLKQVEHTKKDSRCVVMKMSGSGEVDWRFNGERAVDRVSCLPLQRKNRYGYRCAIPEVDLPRLFDRFSHSPWEGNLTRIPGRESWVSFAQERVTNARSISANKASFVKWHEQGQFHFVERVLNSFQSDFRRMPVHFSGRYDGAASIIRLRLLRNSLDELGGDRLRAGLNHEATTTRS